MCDVVYVLLLDEWQAQAMADRQALIARGVAEGLPTMGSTRDRFDEALEAEPVAPGAGLTTEEYELREALGVLK